MSKLHHFTPAELAATFTEVFSVTVTENDIVLIASRHMSWALNYDRSYVSSLLGYEALRIFVKHYVDNAKRGR